MQEPIRVQGIVWVVAYIETSARDYGPIERIFARQRDAEAYAAELRKLIHPAADDIIVDCSAFTLYG